MRDYAKMGVPANRPIHFFEQVICRSAGRGPSADSFLRARYVIQHHKVLFILYFACRGKLR